MASPLLQGKLHISGMDSCAPALARQWQLGLETIAFSYALCWMIPPPCPGRGRKYTASAVCGSTAPSPS